MSNINNRLNNIKIKNKQYSKIIFKYQNCKNKYNYLK